MTEEVVNEQIAELKDKIKTTEGYIEYAEKSINGCKGMIEEFESNITKYKASIKVYKKLIEALQEI